jgi:hypothetical protein
MHSAAFFERDPRRIVEAGLAGLPPNSEYAKLISDLLAWSTNEADWTVVWRKIEEKWNGREPCPEGALRPFNIDAKLNGAYVALGLLYGKGDFTTTIQVSTRAGQDSDCNPSSAAGILGVALGYKAIPDGWKSGIPAIADRKFQYTDYSFRTIVESTEKRAAAMILRSGGKREGDRLVFSAEAPRPAKLALWNDYGSPAERIAVDDARWSWQGKWSVTERSAKTGAARQSAEKGAEASVSFEGTGGILVGAYLPSGGKADIYLDGKLDRTVDVYPDENGRKSGEAVWHAFGLRNGKHTIRLVVRGEPYGGSSGADIVLTNLVVFRR